MGALAAVGLTSYNTTLLFNVARLDVIAFAGMSAVMFTVPSTKFYRSRDLSRSVPSGSARACYGSFSLTAVDNRSPRKANNGSRRIESSGVPARTARRTHIRVSSARFCSA